MAVLYREVVSGLDKSAISRTLLCKVVAHQLSDDPVNGTNARDENGSVILPFDTVPPPQPTFNSGKIACWFRPLCNR